jgi:dihydroorotate dehydrogenase (fumarate)
VADLSTEYAGLKLKNPVIVAPAGITETVDRMKRCEEHRAAAVVVKTLFENELTRKSPTPAFKIIERKGARRTAFTLYSYEQASVLDPDAYAREIEKAKRELSVPVIGSINCETDKGWGDYARLLENAGADALEVNLSCPHFSIAFAGKDVEQNMRKAFTLARGAVKIPVIPKISGQLTSPISVVGALQKEGADAVVLFNRFTGLDIDTKNEMPVMHGGYAGHGGAWSIHYPLRWISAIAPAVDIQIAATGGVSSADDVVKYLLAGAQAVQVCTLVITSGYRIIRSLVRGLEDFMDEKGYKTIDEFRGKVCSRILKYDQVDRSDKVRAHIIPKKCESCGVCFNVCIYGAIDKEEKKYFVNAQCIGCGLCAELCPYDAIRIVER